MMISAIDMQAQLISTDSLSLKFDSLKTAGLAKSAWLRHKADSLRPGIRLSQVDSLKISTASKIDSVTKRFNFAIDSLNSLKMPGEQYLLKVDILYKNYHKRVRAEITNRSDSLSGKAKLKLAKLDSVYATRTRVLDSILVASKGKSINLDSNFKQDMPDFKLPFENRNIDSNINSPLKIDGVSPPNLNNTINLRPDLTLSEDIEGLQKLSDIKDVASDIKTLSKDATELTEEAKKLKEGDHSERLEKEIGNQAKRIDEVNELSKETKVVDQLKGQVESTKEFNDQQAIQKKTKKKFVDYFAGKEDMIQKELDEVGKIQMKYRDIPDARNLPKRKPNEMKEKPFEERLVPSLNFQIFKADEISEDIAPYLGYKFSGKIQAGVSFYKRFKAFQKEYIIKGENLYGFRISQNFKFAPGVYTHLELDRFEDKLSTKIVGQGYTGTYGWNSKVNFGIYRTYSLGKGFKGSMILLYDVLQIKKFPQSSHSAFRFGFEYTIKKHDKRKRED